MANPVKDMRRVKPGKPRDRRLKHGEEARLLEAARHSQAAPWLELTIRLALAAGLRANELLTLQWGQVDTGGREIRLDASTNGNDRVIPMTEEALQVADELRVACVLARADYAKKAAEALNAFRDAREQLSTCDLQKKDSRVIRAFATTSNLDHAFARACMRAGIVGLRFHDLRHEAASRFAPFLQVHELAKLMGWRTIQMAMTYYHPRTAELLASSILARVQRSRARR